MLDRLRNRVSRLFMDDETEEVEVKEDSNQQQTFQTKMVYQYPTKSSFRFPVIPDNEEREQDPLDVPTYQRRRRENRQDVEPNNNEEKNTKKKNQPFVPTEVPSPIYGYQKYKQRKEVENIPAFVRKQHNKQPEKNEQQNPQQNMDFTEVHQENVKEQITTEKPIAIEKGVSSNKDKYDQALDEKSDHSQTSNQLTKKNKQSEHSKKRRRRKRTFNKEQEKSKASPIPFNVMMSANDKMHLQQTRNKNKLKDQIQHEPSNNHEQRAIFPSHLLNDPEIKTNEDRIWVQDQQILLEETLKHFNVKAKVVNATQGPSVTRFEVQPELGVKVSRVRNLNDDIKLNMSAKDIRIEAPIPGKNTIGIEVPNLKPQMVGLQEFSKQQHLNRANHH